jgi:hypothetical protein
MTPDAADQHDTRIAREPLQASGDILVAPRFQAALAAAGLTSIDAIFAFDRGKDLAKRNIGPHRKRLQLEVTVPGEERPTKLYLKRYDHPPRLQQLVHWLTHRRRVSLGRAEHDTAWKLASEGVGTPHTVACGQQWGALFEKRSFLMTREIAQSESLERKLPPCFIGLATSDKIHQRRDFIKELAALVRRFHQTGYRHRDLYFAHIFHSTAGSCCLIDLARAFKPILRRRFQIKDLAQLHYSAPRDHFSRTDRLRFYLAYSGNKSLGSSDKRLMTAIVKKAARMARHNRKHMIPVPYLDRAAEAC